MLLRMLDAAMVATGMLVSLSIYGHVLDESYSLLVTLGILSYLFVAESRGIYHSWRLDGVIAECGHIFAVWFGVVIFLLLLGFMTKTSSEFSRVVIFLWFGLVPAAMSLVRIVLRGILRNKREQGRNTRTVAFAGFGSATTKMVEHLAQMPWLGLNIIGAFDDRMPSRLDLGNIKLNGDLNNLIEQARSGEIDIVYVTLPMQAERRIIQVIEQLADTTVSVYLVPDLFVFSLYKARWATVGGMPVISTFESPFDGAEFWLKRAEDIALSICILIVIFPLMLFIAIAVKLTSTGSVIFKQRRYGLKGEVVEIWKFRSMTACDNGEQVEQAKKNDARLTPLGAFLRRTSLDELPQFFNVLQGTMSIVGPRPHAVAHNELYRKLIRGYMLRHKVKPGITGLAQVNGFRGETDTLDKMQKRVELDLEYIQSWSLWLDIKIIIKTMLVGFVGKNVY
jgi:putative colanic acid biosynthesis UDP-glucose lipid carrier transferase